MAQRRFPKADRAVAIDLRSYGVIGLQKLAELKPEEQRQTIELALLSEETGIPVSELLANRTKLCGPGCPWPNRRRRPLVKKR